jgi:hypothetical protein
MTRSKTSPPTGPAAAPRQRPRGPRGDQTPRLLSVPPRVTSAGRECADLAKSAGLILDPWEQFVLEQALGERGDGKWAAFEVALIVSRQNGKGSILEARELGGLFLFGEQLIVHTAHQFNTCQEAFRRIRALIEHSPHLDRQVKRIDESHGEEGIELRNGQRLRFLARSGSSGRGFSADLLIYDEAMPLAADDVAATLPVLSARSGSTAGGPQVWYTASAGNRKSTQLARVRRRGLTGAAGGKPDPFLAFMEWSIDAHGEHCDPACTEHDPPDTVASYVKANPGLGYRLTVEACERERRSMSAETFARERLGVGTYPVDTDGWAVIPKVWWEDTTMDDAPRPRSPEFAVAVTEDHSAAAIALCGGLPSGKAYAEIPLGCHRTGTNWVVAEAARLDRTWRPTGWVLDKRSAAGALAQALEDAGLNVITPTVTEIGNGCGQLYTAARDGTLLHPRDPDVTVALAGGASRRVSGAWVWDERDAVADMSPIVAVTLAHWSYLKHGGDYDVGNSVHLDVDEIVRLIGLGVYGPGDVTRLYLERLIGDDGLTRISHRTGLRFDALAART